MNKDKWGKGWMDMLRELIWRNMGIKRFLKGKVWLFALTLHSSNEVIGGVLRTN